MVKNKIFKICINFIVILVLCAAVDIGKYIRIIGPMIYTPSIGTADRPSGMIRAQQIVAEVYENEGFWKWSHANTAPWIDNTQYGIIHEYSITGTYPDFLVTYDPTPGMGAWYRTSQSEKQ